MHVPRQGSTGPSLRPALRPRDATDRFLEFDHGHILSFWLLAAFVLCNGLLAYRHTARVYENGRVVAEGSEQQALVEKLRAAVGFKEKQLSETISLRREQGFEAARAVMLTDLGRQAMLDIRAATTAIDDLEEKEFARRAEGMRAPTCRASPAACPSDRRRSRAGRISIAQGHGSCWSGYAEDA